MGMGLKGEKFPVASWQKSQHWTGFTQRSAYVNQAQNCQWDSSLSQNAGEAAGPCGMAMRAQQHFSALHMVGKKTPRSLQGSEEAQRPGSGSAICGCEDRIQMWKQLEQRSKPPNQSRIETL